MHDEKVERTQFKMMKWELYRQKCDSIDDKYATFKKT